MNHFKILKEFQDCLSIQLSKICITQTQYLSGVLSLICYRLPRRLVYNIIRYTHCQQLFSKSFKKVQFFSIIDFQAGLTCLRNRLFADFLHIYIVIRKQRPTVIFLYAFLVGDNSCWLRYFQNKSTRKHPIQLIA